MNTQLPQAPEVERALLGATLTYPHLVPEVDLDPDTFWDERHRWIWAAQKDLDRNGRSADPTTVMDLLKTRSQFAAIQNGLYISELIDGLPFAYDIEEYTGILRDRFDRRQAIMTAQKLAKDAYNLQSPFEQSKAEAIDRLATSSSAAGDVYHVSHFMDELHEVTMERVAHPSEVWGIDLGFVDFNKITGGLQVGLTLLAGEPGVGKTLFLVQAAVQAAQLGQPGALFELEMGGVQLARRMVSAVSGVRPWSMQTGIMDAKDKDLFERGIKEISELPLYISESTSWTATSWRAAVTRLQVRHGIEWTMLDYLLLLQDIYGRDEIERGAFIARGVRRAAKDLGMPTLAVHTMNKDGLKQKVKDLSALGGSTSIIYDADMAVFMNRHILTKQEEENGMKPQPNVRTLTWGKNREGSDRLFMNLVMRPGLPAFADYTPERTANAQRVDARVAP